MPVTDIHSNRPDCAFVHAAVIPFFGLTQLSQLVEFWMAK